MASGATRHRLVEAADKYRLINLLSKPQQRRQRTRTYPI